MDLFALSAKLTLDSSDYMRGIDQSESLGKRFANNLSARTVAVGQMLGNFATRAVSTVGSTLKDVIVGAKDAYADYEQLVGGIETLFGTGGRTLEQYLADVGSTGEKAIAKYNSLQNAQETALKNAQNAYKTAGMSANEYMETATSFAASLVSSLFGDTEQAVAYADMAVQDMSDNANKMGTDISAIQNAYQGFAKQNYTMLDNLKLGYGGTKTEMERLLADAMKITGKKYNLNNLAHVYEAIHVIQEELGITGTTAKEAEGTISGSINMMKASWQNLLTAFGDPNADLGQKIDQFTDSLGKVVQNLFPVFKRIVKNIWNSLTQFAGNLGGLIFGKNEEGEVNWPDWDDIKGAALSLWNRLKNYAKDLAGLVFGKKKDGSVDWPEWNDVKAKAEEIWANIKAKAKDLAGLMFGNHADGSVDWPNWNDVKAKATEIWGNIKEQAKKLGGLIFGTHSDGTVDWPTWNDVKAKANEIWGNIKAEAKKLTGLVFGDTATAADMFNRIKTKWEEVKKTIEDKVINIATSFFGDTDPETIKSAIGGVADALKAIGAALVAYFTVQKIQGIIRFFTEFKSVFTTAVGKNKLGLILAAVAAAITLIIENWDKIEPVIQQVGSWLQENLISPIMDFVDAMKEAIKQVGNFLGLDTSGWFRDPTQMEQETVGTGPLTMNTAHLDDAQVQSLVAAREIAKQNPNAMVMDSNGTTRNAEQALKEQFDQTLRAAGFSEDVINKLSSRLSGLSDQGFLDLMTALRNAAGYYDENGKKVSELGNAEGTTTSKVASLGAAADSAAKSLSSIGEGSSTSDGYTQRVRNSKLPGHASGLLRVPYDDYVARLHRGERVLTASQARKYRDGSRMDLSGLGDIVREAIQQGMSMATVQSFLSGRDITDDTNRNTMRELKSRRFAT